MKAVGAGYAMPEYAKTRQISVVSHPLKGEQCAPTVTGSSRIDPQQQHLHCLHSAARLRCVMCSYDVSIGHGCNDGRALTVFTCHVTLVRLDSTHLVQVQVELKMERYFQC